MDGGIERSKAVLEEFLMEPQDIDRDHVIAHATLSGFAHHWPERCTPAIRRLLDETRSIPEQERSRWIVQRRIAIAKIARELDLAF